MSFPAATLNPLRRETLLRVRLFGPVRLLAQRDFCEIMWPAEGSADEFWTRFLAEFPALRPARASIRLARDGEFLRGDERLRPGDEVALIPPVSGG